MSSRSSFDHFSGVAKMLAEQRDREHQDKEEIASAQRQLTAQAQEAKRTLIQGSQDIFANERQLEQMKEANERKLEQMKAELDEQKAELAAYAQDISQYKRLNALDSYPNQA
jgi:chromosome segregation ATPase